MDASRHAGNRFKECVKDGFQPKMIVTAVLATGVAKVARGKSDAINLFDLALSMDHTHSETTMHVGDIEFRNTREGPFPNHQLRLSVDPERGFAAINYMDHDDAEMPVANSFNPIRPLPDVALIFNGSTGLMFPRAAAIPINRAREALIEWLHTRQRPKCIEWRPYDKY